jgi:hypothetical protein
LRHIVGKGMFKRSVRHTARGWERSKRCDNVRKMLSWAVTCMHMTGGGNDHVCMACIRGCNMHACVRCGNMHAWDRCRNMRAFGHDKARLEHLIPSQDVSDHGPIHCRLVPYHVDYRSGDREQPCSPVNRQQTPRGTQDPNAEGYPGPKHRGVPRVQTPRGTQDSDSEGYPGFRRRGVPRVQIETPRGCPVPRHRGVPRIQTPRGTPDPDANGVSSIQTLRGTQDPDIERYPGSRH